jgi:hypothetical protein
MEPNTAVLASVLRNRLLDYHVETLYQASTFFNTSQRFVSGGEPKMNDSMHNASEVNLESVARNVARELIQSIVWASESEADVPATVERLFSLICSEWQQVDWSQYGSAFGIDPLDDSVRFAEEHDDETVY